jgi:hypothetical protein
MRTSFKKNILLLVIKQELIVNCGIETWYVYVLADAWAWEKWKNKRCSAKWCVGASSS